MIKQITYIVLWSVALLMSCNKDKDGNECIKSKYTYHAQSGQCVNCEGIVGFNTLDLPKIRETKDAECMNLSGIKLVYLLDTSKIEDFHEVGDNIIEGYNFKGSLFDTSELYFNKLLKSSFEGADLRNIKYGYAEIHGSIDKHTQAPAGCTNNVDSIFCKQ